MFEKTINHKKINQNKMSKNNNEKQNQFFNDFSQYNYLNENILNNFKDQVINNYNVKVNITKKKTKNIQIENLTLNSNINNNNNEYFNFINNNNNTSPNHNNNNINKIIINSPLNINTSFNSPQNEKNNVNIKKNIKKIFKNKINEDYYNNNNDELDLTKYNKIILNLKNEFEDIKKNKIRINSKDYIKNNKRSNTASNNSYVSNNNIINNNIHNLKTNNNLNNKISFNNLNFENKIINTHSNINNNSNTKNFINQINNNKNKNIKNKNKYIFKPFTSKGLQKISFKKSNEKENNTKNIDKSLISHQSLNTTTNLIKEKNPFFDNVIVTEINFNIIHKIKLSKNLEIIKNIKNNNINQIDNIDNIDNNNDNYNYKIINNFIKNYIKLQEEVFIKKMNEIKEKFNINKTINKLNKKIEFLINENNLIKNAFNKLFNFIKQYYDKNLKNEKKIKFIFSKLIKENEYLRKITYNNLIYNPENISINNNFYKTMKDSEDFFKNYFKKHFEKENELKIINEKNINDKSKIKNKITNSIVNSPKNTSKKLLKIQNNSLIIEKNQNKKLHYIKKKKI